MLRPWFCPPMLAPNHFHGLEDKTGWEDMGQVWGPNPHLPPQASHACAGQADAGHGRKQRRGFRRYRHGGAGDAHGASPATSRGQADRILLATLTLSTSSSTVLFYLRLPPRPAPHPDARLLVSQKKRNHPALLMSRSGGRA